MQTRLRRLFSVSIPSAGPLKRAELKTIWKRRFRAMMRHTWLLGTAIVLLLGGIGSLAYYFASQPVFLKIAVGPPNSEDVQVVQAMAQQLARDRASVRLRPVIKDGGARDAKDAIDAGEVDLAIVRRDFGMPKEGQVVAIWRKNVAIFIVPAQAPEAGEDKAKPVRAAGDDDTGKKPDAEQTMSAPAKPAPVKDDKIEKIHHLVGKRLALVGRSQSNLDLLKAVLREYSIPADKIVYLTPETDTKIRLPDKISVLQLSTSQFTPAIRDGNFDAIMTVGPVSSLITASIINIATRGNEAPTIIDIDVSETISERNPVYEATEIKAGAFGGAPLRPKESIDTIGVNHYLVVRRKLGEDTVANFTRQLFAIRQALADDVPSSAKIEKPDTSKAATVSVHPGAAAYIDGEVKTFFDRYNDYIYLGILLFSVFGSAIAGMASYSRADDRARRLQTLEKLLDLTRAARSAETVGRLDELQIETDDLLATMVQEVEADTLDESALIAFSIMLDQTQLAIADRRETLTGQPGRARMAVASL
jgi:TRAP-type uncharacterized transport system substrate-binding protein